VPTVDKCAYIQLGVGDVKISAKQCLFPSIQYNDTVGTLGDDGVELALIHVTYLHSLLVYLH
jgi:hypothetical protein